MQGVSACFRLTVPRETKNLERAQRCGSSSISGRRHPSKPPGFRPTGSGPASAGSTRRWGRSERQKSAAGDRLAHAPGLFARQVAAQRHGALPLGGSARRSNPNTVVCGRPLETRDHSFCSPGHLVKRFRVSGLSVRRVDACRRPAWRCADRVHIALSRSKALQQFLVSPIPSRRLFALALLRLLPRPRRRRSAQRMFAIAPETSSRPGSRCPIFETFPSLGFPPVECWRGTSPSQAGKPPAPELLHRRREGQERHGADGADARNAHQPLRLPALPRPPEDLRLQLLDPSGQDLDLAEQQPAQLPDRLRQPRLRILERRGQPGHVRDPLRRHHAVLPGCPRSASAVCVLCFVRRLRVRNSIPSACCSALSAATNRIPGRDAASQTASASAASFFRRFTNGFTYAGGTRRTSNPIASSSRPRCRAPAQASIATVQGPRFDISSRNRSRDTFFRKAADPSSRTPWSWKLLLPRSTPIMPVFSIVDAPFSCGALVPP